MIRFARDFRLIPIVLFATVSLFALKVSGLVFDGGYTLAERMQGRYKTEIIPTTAESVPAYPKITIADRRTPAAPPESKQSWAQQMFNYSDGASRDITGSISKEEKSAGPPLKASNERPPEVAKLEAGSTSIAIEPGRISSPGERAVLERLQERRHELDARSREMDMRESLLKAAEKRVEAKIAELKAMEERVKAATATRDQKEADRFKSVVAMYESMKAKDAARIFDRLDLKILVDVSIQINPRKMSEILAQMTPESAERLTVELAQRASATKNQAADKLPKIEGRPNG